MPASLAVVDPVWRYVTADRGSDLPEAIFRSRLTLAGWQQYLIDPANNNLVTDDLG